MVTPGEVPPDPEAFCLVRVMLVASTDTPQVEVLVVPWDSPLRICTSSGSRAAPVGHTTNPCAKLVVVSASSAVMVHDL